MTDRSRVVKFPVWPDRSRKKPYFYRVFVFGSRKAMEIYWKAHTEKIGMTGSEAAFNFLAVTSTWTTLTIRISKGKDGRRRWKQDNCIGHMLFYRKRVGAGIVAHECTHAALRFAEVILKIPARDLYHARRGGRAPKNEERFCHAIGDLVSQFWCGFYARAPKAWHKPG